MPASRITFDRDGDLLLRLTSPAKDQNDEASSEQSVEIPTVTPTSSTSSVAKDLESTLLLHKEVHMLVSSKHLTLASPVFKAMLKSNFCTGELLTSHDVAEIELPDEDPEAFEILMNILHGRVRQVPKQINLKLATKLAIIVDKYLVLEPVEIYVRQWLSSLRKWMPEGFNSNILPWLCVSWVFRMEDDFQWISRMAVRESVRKLETFDLPILSTVLDAIEHKRQSGIAEMLRHIEALHSACSEPSICDNPEYTEQQKSSCQYIIQGTLVNSLCAERLWPLPETPHEGLSLKRVLQSVRKLVIASLEDCKLCSKKWKDPLEHGWTGRHLAAMAEKIEREANGLEISAFRKEARLKRSTIWIQ
ncbi:hypothetical protein EG329_007760 [Mollisiaceae sp. DMI_Dod_QoI]|nr:hypothetical protein EG329_007760 [Helotiales sp. DMI_Dod_QoI]